MVWFVWLCFVLQHSLKKYYGGMSKIAILENTKNENKKELNIIEIGMDVKNIQ